MFNDNQSHFWAIIKANTRYKLVLHLNNIIIITVLYSNTSQFKQNTEREFVSYLILMACQPQRITSGWGNKNKHQGKVKSSENSKKVKTVNNQLKSIFTFHLLQLDQNADLFTPKICLEKTFSLTSWFQKLYFGIFVCKSHFYSNLIIWYHAVRLKIYWPSKCDVLLSLILRHDLISAHICAVLPLFELTILSNFWSQLLSKELILPRYVKYYSF